MSNDELEKTLKEIQQFCRYAIGHYNNPIGYHIDKERSIELWVHLQGYCQGKLDDLTYSDEELGIKD